MTVVNSSPSTFTITMPFTSEQVSRTVTFAIPSGPWLSGTWNLQSSTASANYDPSIVTASESASMGGASGGVSNNQTLAVDATQLADINAAAGGNLSVSLQTFYTSLGDVWSITSFTLTLSGCTFSESPSSASIAVSGGSGTIALTANSGSCTWAAVSNASWIHLTGLTSGTGNASVAWIADTNCPSTSARAGTITMGGLTFTVNQAGCVFTTNIANVTYDYKGGAGAVVATSSSPGCPWDAVSTVPWIHIVSGIVGNTTGTIGYTVDSNPPTGLGRMGVIVVGTQVVQVWQQSGPQVQFSNENDFVYHYLSFQYPFGYVSGVNLAQYFGNVAQVFVSVRSKDQNLATLAGNVLALYNGGTELTNGAACLGADIMVMGV
jgi:hypothetical protein